MSAWVTLLVLLFKIASGILDYLRDGKKLSEAEDILIGKQLRDLYKKTSFAQDIDKQIAALSDDDVDRLLAAYRAGKTD